MHAGVHVVGAVLRILTLHEVLFITTTAFLATLGTRQLVQVVLDVFEGLVAVFSERWRYTVLSCLPHQEADDVQLEAVIVSHENLELILLLIGVDAFAGDFIQKIQVSRFEALVHAV